MNLFKLPAGVALIVLILFVIGCSVSSGNLSTSQTTTTKTFQIPSTYTTYKDDINHFSVSYPSQWEPTSDLTSMSTDTVDFLFYAGMKTTAGYSNNVNVTTASKPVGMSTIGQVVDAEMLGFKEAVNNYQEISRTKTTVNGQEAVLVEFKVQFSPAGPTFHNLQLITVSGKTLWMLACSSADTDFVQWAGDFNNVVLSFKLTD